MSNFGFNLRRGNSDQVEANTVTSARRPTVTTRVVLDYLGNLDYTMDYRLLVVKLEAGAIRTTS